MNKTELIAAVAEKSGLTQKDSKKVVEALLDVVKEDVAAGNKVQILGFGTFESRKREARSGFNPLTKEPIEIKASVIPVFKAGKAFKAVMPVPVAKKASKKSKK